MRNTQQIFNELKSVKKAADESLLGMTLVPYLFIAPLSLISIRRLLYCDTRPYVLSTQDDISFRFQLAQWVCRCLCVTVVTEQNACSLLVLCDEMASFEVLKFMADALTAKAKCPPVTLPHVSSSKLVLTLESFPSLRKASALIPSPIPCKVGGNVCCLSCNNSCPP